MAHSVQPAGPADLAAITARLEQILTALLDRAALVQRAVLAGDPPPPELLEWLRVVESLTLSCERLARALRSAQTGGGQNDEAAFWQINEQALARRGPADQGGNDA